MSDFVPHYRQLAPPPEGRARGQLLMLHGILGNGENLRSLGRKLAARRPDYRVTLVDLREHGGSVGAPPPHTLDAAAGDLVRLAAVLAESGPPVRAVCGHSFGGKVALRLRQMGALDLAATWVLDASPGALAPSALVRGLPKSIASVVAALEAVPREEPSRDAAVAALTEKGLLREIAQWLAQNYVRYGEGVRLRLALDSIRALLQDHASTDLWEAVEDPNLPGRVDVVVAGKSEAIPPPDVKRLESASRKLRGRVFVEHLADAGHWVHVDAPAELLELMCRALPELFPSAADDT